ncbi:PAAR domain-containing protein [Burkholderia lata]|uniref:PAAR domain-containing protein n=1 Tax=Burkholderia lata (strain ATCC 17760 / DSM 23089 / LMG 22485 / NCIMB 9086 / R18194 / 383) TaxID=482957 RepID=UPI0020C7301B
MGGFVTASTATAFDHGRRLALDGDEATCGNCEGQFKIVGSATRMTWHGRKFVLEGDSVLCPCGMNKVLSREGCRVFHEHHGHGVAGVDVPSSRESSQHVVPRGHDEQFVIRDKRTKHPLSNVHYWIKDLSGNVLAAGVSDAEGCTSRIRTEGAQTLKLVIGD